MLPIALERATGLERLSPLAVVAIGGLMVATFLTLIYVPLFYEFYRVTAQVAAFFGKKTQQTGEIA